MGMQYIEKIPNYKLQITNKKTKGSHGLPQGSFKLQTMTAFMKSFCRGVQMLHGGSFFKKRPPLAAGGIILSVPGRTRAIFFYEMSSRVDCLLRNILD
jgi:hypothetical protein